MRYSNGSRSSSIILETIKSIEETKNKIYYITNKNDKDIYVEWEGWNLGEVKKISDIISVWTDHIEAKKKYLILNPHKGRPPVRTAYYIIINEGVHTDFFKYIRDALWNWINLEFYSNYMGIIAYHFPKKEENRFHIHIVINPVPLSLEDSSILRLSKRDPSWKNIYYNERDKSINKFLIDVALMLGGKKKPDGSVEIPILVEEEKRYIDIIRQSKKEIFKSIVNNRIK